MGVSQNDGRMEGWSEFYQLFCCWVCLNLHPLCKHSFTFFDFSGLNVPIFVSIGILSTIMLLDYSQFTSFVFIFWSKCPYLSIYVNFINYFFLGMFQFASFV